jgi:hypothetical protein
MAQTKKEKMLVFYPMAKVVFHPGGSGADSIVLGSPRLGTNGSIAGYDRLSKCFLLDTDHDLIWADGYHNFIERAKQLIESEIP